MLRDISEWGRVALRTATRALSASTFHSVVQQVDFVSYHTPCGGRLTTKRIMSTLETEDIHLTDLPVSRTRADRPPWYPWWRAKLTSYNYHLSSLSVHNLA